MAYESQVLPVPSKNGIQVTITRNGEEWSSYQPLKEAFDAAEGPMSLEAGCMSAVRSICQHLWSEMTAEEGSKCQQSG